MLAGMAIQGLPNDDICSKWNCVQEHRSNDIVYGNHMNILAYIHHMYSINLIRYYNIIILLLQIDMPRMCKENELYAHR